MIETVKNIINDKLTMKFDDIVIKYNDFSKKYPKLMNKILNDDNFDIQQLENMLKMRNNMNDKTESEITFKFQHDLYKKYIKDKLSPEKLASMINEIMNEITPVVNYISQRRPQWERVNDPQKLKEDLESKYKSILDKYGYIISAILEKNMIDLYEIKMYLEDFYLN